jgi:hypothetical protein
MPLLPSLTRNMLAERKRLALELLRLAEQGEGACAFCDVLVQSLQNNSHPFFDCFNRVCQVVQVPSIDCFRPPNFPAVVGFWWTSIQTQFRADELLQNS